LGSPYGPVTKEDSRKMSDGKKGNNVVELPGSSLKRATIDDK
jgi:hypothetical protein